MLFEGVKVGDVAAYRGQRVRSTTVIWEFNKVTRLSPRIITTRMGKFWRSTGKLTHHISNGKIAREQAARIVPLTAETNAKIQQYHQFGRLSPRSTI